MDIAQTARKALEILDADGWCKGSVHLCKDSQYMVVIMNDTGREWIKPDLSSYRDGSHCLGGAWNVALHGEPSFLRDADILYEPVISVILAQYPEIAEMGLNRTSVILHFNDRTSTSESDVRAILEKLAAS